MSKQLLAAVLLVSVFLQSFSGLIILADFYANQDFIAKNICVNRKQPLSCCQGHCYLQKKLAKDNHDQQPGEKKSNFESPVYSIREENIQSPLFLLVPPAPVYATYQPARLQDRVIGIFRPPQL